jgi:hypothetical protein
MLRTEREVCEIVGGVTAVIWSANQGTEYSRRPRGLCLTDAVFPHETLGQGVIIMS